MQFRQARACFSRSGIVLGKVHGRPRVKDADPRVQQGIIFGKRRQNIRLDCRVESIESSLEISVDLQEGDVCRQDAGLCMHGPKRNPACLAHSEKVGVRFHGLVEIDKAFHLYGQGGQDLGHRARGLDNTRCYRIRRGLLPSCTSRKECRAATRSARDATARTPSSTRRRKIGVFPSNITLLGYSPGIFDHWRLSGPFIGSHIRSTGLPSGKTCVVYSGLFPVFPIFSRFSHYSTPKLFIFSLSMPSTCRDEVIKMDTRCLKIRATNSLFLVTPAALLVFQTAPAGARLVASYLVSGNGGACIPCTGM